MTDDQRTSRKRRSSVVTLVIEAICNADVSTTSQASIRECKPDGYFSNPVYGFDGLQTRVPGFDYVSPAGGRYSTVQLVVTCQRQTRELCTISYAAAGG